MKLPMPLFILLFALPIQAADIDTYRFSRSIQWQSSGQQELLAVTLDKGVYAATRDGFPDFRLIDNEGIETPYWLERIAETKTEKRRLSVASQLDSLKKKDKAIEIELTLDKDAEAAEGLTVATPLTDFEHRLQVFGSNDGSNWEPLVKDADIFDYSSYMAVSDCEVDLPANSFRKFKVVVEEATQNRESELMELSRKLQQNAEVERLEKVDIRRIPLKIDRIEFWRTENDVLPDELKTFEYPVARFSVTEDQENRNTVIDVDTARQPLTGLKIQTSTAHYKRKATVQVPVKHGVQSVMETVGSGTLEALHFRDVNRDFPTVSFPEQRHTNYRMVIQNLDNPPLAITGMTGIGNGYRLIFMPASRKTYSLRYGSDKAKLPNYETDSIRELLRKGYPSSLAELSAETEEKQITKSFDWAELLNSRGFLITVVVLMVIVLGWVLMRVGKGIDQFPKQ